jgi:hypothetical protein
MNRTLRTLTLGFMFFLGCTGIASAAAAPDPAIGTWTLNLSKSKFHGETAPKSMTRTYTAVAGGTELKTTGVEPDGTAFTESSTLTYDGKDCVMTGGTLYDTLTLTKVNGSTVKSELKKGGKVVGHSTRIVSAKGKVLTLSTAWKTDKGGTTHDVAVFDKQ